ncbi:MAG: LuxR family transcriptional regulator [Sphingobium sp.]|nr:LuxR family transcriptional regulator [Sphingobium sp.]
MAFEPDIHHRIARTHDIDMLWRLTVDHFGDMGFDAVGYVLLQRGQPENPVALFAHGLSDELVHAYAEMGYGKHDPAARYGLATGKPFRRSQLPDQTSLSRKEWQHRQRLEDLGLRESLILPVFGPNNTNGILALAFPREGGLIDRLNWSELQALAQVIHLRCIALQPDHAIEIDNPLSGRELEILRWVAQGKSNAVIAEILQISAGTVDTYLRRVFEKLNVADRTSAAVKGVGLGLIAA